MEGVWGYEGEGCVRVRVIRCEGGGDIRLRM